MTSWPETKTTVLMTAIDCQQNLLPGNYDAVGVHVTNGHF